MAQTLKKYAKSKYRTMPKKGTPEQIYLAFAAEADHTFLESHAGTLSVAQALNLITLPEDEAYVFLTMLRDFEFDGERNEELVADLYIAALRTAKDSNMILAKHVAMHLHQSPYAPVVPDPIGINSGTFDYTEYLLLPVCHYVEDTILAIEEEISAPVNTYQAVLYNISIPLPAYMNYVHMPAPLPLTPLAPNAEDTKFTFDLTAVQPIVVIGNTTVTTLQIVQLILLMILIWYNAYGKFTGIDPSQYLWTVPIDRPNSNSLLLALKRANKSTRTKFKT